MIQFNEKEHNHSLRNSKGNQTKLVIDDIWYKLDYLGFEAASEEFVSCLLKHSNVPEFVDYQMCDITWKESIFHSCASKNFLSEKMDLITLDDILIANLGVFYEKTLEKMSTKEKIKYVVDLVEEYTGLNHFGEYLTLLLELDAFTLNEDRHFQNISILRTEGNHYKIAPIFDNGASYCSDLAMDYPIDKPLKTCISKVKAKPFSTDFEKQMNAARQLYGFQLQIVQDIPELQDLFERIEKVYSKQIAMRMKMIYQLQCQKNKELYVPEITRQVSFSHKKNSIER